MGFPNNIPIYIAAVYMFFNSIFLPQGLYFTTLLTPFFFMGLIKQNELKYYLSFLIVSLLLLCIQIRTVEHFTDYITSFILLQMLAVFVIYVFCYLKNETNLANIYKSLALINLLLLIIALIVLFIPAIRSSMWYLIPISPNIPIIPRLKMFTFEASYYSLIIFPVAGYYILKKIVLRNDYNILFFTLCLSIFLSFSLGVTIAMVISIFILLILNWNELRFKIHFNFLMAGILLLSVSCTALYFFYPHNPLFERFRNIYLGEDTSSRGRTYEAFHIAWNVAKMKSLFWGCGLGQFKYIGRDFVDYYYSNSKIPSVIRIPNAVAETLSIYGIAGLIVRFFLIFYLFIKTKVWNNYYRELLFIFIFIYQFTGSYLFNPAEYVIWILAFSPSIFPIFKREKIIYKIN